METVGNNKASGFCFHFLSLFLKTVFIHERGRDTGRGRSRLPAGSPMQDSIPGPWDHNQAKGSTTEPPWHPYFLLLNHNARKESLIFTEASMTSEVNSKRKVDISIKKKIQVYIGILTGR